MFAKVVSDNTVVKDNCVVMDNLTSYVGGMASAVTYRRGNLREALVDRALIVLRERGSGAISLRELARDVGVSHAAPSRHFADRRQLFDALAVEGFALLGARIRAASAGAYDKKTAAGFAARAYVEFATREANLNEVMYRHEPGRDASAIGRSASTAFAPIEELFDNGHPDSATAATLFLATLQGIAGLVNCGVVPPDQAYPLISDAVPRFFSTESVEETSA
jgi:AcrR family transcriptional regulator